MAFCARCKNDGLNYQLSCQFCGSPITPDRRISKKKVDISIPFFDYSTDGNKVAVSANDLQKILRNIISNEKYELVDEANSPLRIYRLGDFQIIGKSSQYMGKFVLLNCSFSATSICAIIGYEVAFSDIETSGLVKKGFLLGGFLLKNIVARAFGARSAGLNPPDLGRGRTFPGEINWAGVLPVFSKEILERFHVKTKTETIFDSSWISDSK